MNKGQFNTGSSTVGETLDRFHREHGLGEDGGEQDRWAKVQMGRINLYFPNTASRRRALLFHDVHHLATGYKTDFRGEAEIGAWEIASGCRDFWAAWTLNFFAFAMGLIIAPIRTFRAFVRGRGSSNLYAGQMTREEIKAASIQEIQQFLRLDRRPQRAGLMDILLFIVWSLPIMVAIGMVVALLIWIF